MRNFGYYYIINLAYCQQRLEARQYGSFNLKILFEIKFIYRSLSGIETAWHVSACLNLGSFNGGKCPAFTAIKLIQVPGSFIP